MFAATCLCACSVAWPSGPPAVANGCITSGTGIAADPYIVATEANLFCIANNASSYWTGNHFRQTADITLTSAWSISIGSSGTAFTGTYDGQGYSISGLSVLGSGSEDKGLFGVTNGATLTGVRVYGSVAGASNTGGLIGQATSTTVTDCHANVSIRGERSSMSFDSVGGLIGSMTSGTVTSSSSSGAVTIFGSGRYVGGLVGHLNTGTVASSTASGDVRLDSATTPGPNAGEMVGGLVGRSYGSTIRESSASGNVTRGYVRIGGLVGFQNGGTVERSFATGTVSGEQEVGGLAGAVSQVGPAPNILRDVFARGAVSASVGAGGGLIGGLSASGAGPERAYATGAVSGSGGLGGFAGSASGSATSSFWDTQATGQATAKSGGGAISGITGETTALMKDIATYQSAGWSISPSWAASGTTWGICPRVNDGYPYLQALYTSDPCSGSAGLAPPPPWHQSYARAVEQTCLTGWNPSWAQWPSGGAGGFVCDRTLLYNSSTGVWDVRLGRKARPSRG